MAVLKEPTGGTNQFGPAITKLAPKGTYLATVVDIIDTFGVDRPKFEDPTTIEKVDLTIFVFGIGFFPKTFFWKSDATLDQYSNTILTKVGNP